MNLPLKGYLSVLVLTSGFALTILGLSSCGESGNDEKANKRLVNSSKVDDRELSGQEALRLFLPTDNREIFGDPSKFYMYTNRTFEGVQSKPWEGGQYGFVRNQIRSPLGVIYTRLHEGMDIRPVRRDGRGEPLDDVRTIADGVVTHVNDTASASNYGKYVVVRHSWREGAFYSLYAHLMTTRAKVGQNVRAGDTLGRLGYTGAGIDRERAHVHVELNFLLSERFTTWYSKHFTSPNKHGIHNGINMTGMDIARFFLEHRKNPAITMREFLDGEEVYYKVKAPVSGVPGILQRYPFLGKGMEGARSAKSWEFSFAQTGVPLSISPSSTELKYPAVTWVKPMNTNHSYLTMGRLSGSGSRASLSASGSRYIQLISESF
ncbi:MAG: M23 family metallopeptidase [Verrucomicrobiales bacterium]|nr:M23 family metallopeptidase [Verrucomicrobiales bacterium]